MTAKPAISAAFLAIALLGAGAATTREIDASASKATFSLQHVFVEHVTGTVPIASGSVTLPTGSTIPESVSAVLNPSKIKTGEDDRDGVLQTPDWFDVKQYPTWTFTSTKISPADANAFGMDGLLTIHGVTRSEHLDVTVTGTPAHPTYHATGTIDRHAFGMTVTRLDPAIGNPVSVTLDVTLK
jgi:polyisoprenoid-binding protein YceI